MKKQKDLIPPSGEFILYQTEDGRARIEARFHGETVWLSLNQMVGLFQRDKSVISKHIRNIFNEGELMRTAVVANFATTAAWGLLRHGPAALCGKRIKI